MSGSVCSSAVSAIEMSASEIDSKDLMNSCAEDELFSDKKDLYTARQRGDSDNSWDMGGIDACSDVTSDPGNDCKQVEKSWGEDRDIPTSWDLEDETGNVVNGNTLSVSVNNESSDKATHCTAAKADGDSVLDNSVGDTLPDVSSDDCDNCNTADVTNVIKSSYEGSDEGLGEDTVKACDAGTATVNGRYTVKQHVNNDRFDNESDAKRREQLLRPEQRAAASVQNRDVASNEKSVNAASSALNNKPSVSRPSVIEQITPNKPLLKTSHDKDAKSHCDAAGALGSGSTHLSSAASCSISSGGTRVSTRSSFSSSTTVQSTGTTAASVTGSQRAQHGSPASSPHSSASGSPQDGGSGTGASSQQYVVNVYVNPGETFSVRVGDQVQLIQGPATVRMVSNSGPPLPMPMQVPPGHMVQQIVDENGILTHVILSPQPPGIPAPPMMNAQNGGPMYGGGGPGQYMGGGGAPPPHPHYHQSYNNPPQYMPHHPLHQISAPHQINQQRPHAHHAGGPLPPHHAGTNQGGGGGAVGGGPPHHHHHYCPSYPTNHNSGGAGGMSQQQQQQQSAVSDSRTQRTKARLIEKLNKRKGPNSGGGASGGGGGDHHQVPHHNTGPGPGQHGKRTRASAPTHNSSNTGGGGRMDQGGVTHHSDDVMMDEECRAILDLLSKIPPPKVSEMEARRALVQLTPPSLSDTTSAGDTDIDQAEFIYELQLSEKKDSGYTTMYTGDATEIRLKDLKPATDYYLRVRCIIDELQGGEVDAAPFTTLSCEPEPPPPPRLTNKTKTSLLLKWNAAVDNGSKILSYVLEYDQGQGDMKFVEVYSGPQKQFKVVKLSPATGYLFRLAAVNAHGRGDYSENVYLYTSGTAPTQTDPPMLAEQCVKALTISWIKRPCDDSFTLQMEDVATGHGFLPIYNGTDLSYKIHNLRRNTEYKFRLQARNVEGQSQWSDVVAYRTLPDRPQPPARPQLKGRATTNSFRILWDEPRDTGGSDVSRYRIQLDAGNGYQVVHESCEREFVVERLQPGHTYRMRISAVGPGGQSDWSEVLIVTTQAVAPGPCGAPRLHGRPKANTINIVWDDPEFDGGSQPTEYAVLLTGPDPTTAALTSREVYKGHDLECMVAGLLPGRQYQLQARAFNKAGAGPWSEPVEVMTGAGVPDAPNHPDIHCRSAHCALISWEEPPHNGAPITEYRLECQVKDEQDFTPVYSGLTTSFEIARLSPATFYAFRVQAVNSAGAGPFSPTSSTVTPPTSPGPVLSVRASSKATNIHLTWKEPLCNGSKITSYNIDIGEKHVIAVDNTLEYTICNLLPETIYKVRVQAVNSIGVGPFSSIVKVTTRALPPNPPVLECVAAGSNSLKLKWGDGKNSDLIQYCVELQREAGCFQPVYHGTGQSHKVNKLTEQTEYYFRIYASNEAGDGPPSSLYTFQTTKAAPPPPKAPKLSCITQSSCLVEWGVVRLPGGTTDNIGYVVQIQRNSAVGSGGGGGKDAVEYREVYRGLERQYTVTGLCGRTDYHVRVAAVRQCEDGEVLGAFSQSVLLTTAGNSTPSSSKSPSAQHSPSSPTRSDGLMSRLTEQHLAIIILLAFALSAVVIAFVAKLIIDYTASGGAVVSRGTAESAVESVNDMMTSSGADDIVNRTVSGGS